MFFYLLILIILNNEGIISWKNTIDNLSRLQRRIFKSVLTKNLKKCFYFQQLLVKSRVARLVAIRSVSNLQLSSRIYQYSDFSSNKDFSLAKKIALLNSLSSKFYSWSPSKKELLFISSEMGKIKDLAVFTVDDRCWQALVKLLLEPTYEAFFEPQNLGFRFNISFHFIQRIFLLNLSKKSYGFQKRILLFKIKTPFNVSNYEPFFSKLFLNRKLKMIIYRFLKLGLILDFNECNCQMNQMVPLLSNIFLIGFKVPFDWVRVGSSFVFFLRPFDNEIIVLDRCRNFFNSLSLKSFQNDFSIVTLYEGFDFLGWNFRCSDLGNLICIPSLSSYRRFLLRVKSIINNSNYGAVCKVS